jgi:ABC-2 type transport system ATP-binding protein
MFRKADGMSQDVIIAEGLTKIFNEDLVAVDHVSFSVKSGEIFGFLGPNGAGKTTTIKMLTTVLKPTEGKAFILGKEVAEQNTDVKNSIGVLQQVYTADEDLTGYQNIMLIAALYGVPKDVARKRSLELLGLVELTAFKDKEVQTYSGGMRRRLELICSLINNPKVLFLDEPTLGLDVQTRAATWNYLKTLKKEFGMTFFLTTHYMEEADLLCDRVAIIDHGKIVTIDTPNDLKKKLGGDIIMLSVQNCADDISDLIKAVPSVKSVQKQQDGSYRVKVENSEETAPSIMDAVRAEGYKVARLSLERPTLDEVYLEFTGKSLREEGGSKVSAFQQRETIRKAGARSR